MAAGLLNNNKPSPFTHGQESPELTLANLDQLTLITFLFVDTTPEPLQYLSLEESDELQDNIITSLFKTSKSTSSEEDQGVTKPVSVPAELDLVHESIDSCLVVS
jgi:hypothetical protein